jgi:hypothetical protein
MVVLHKLDINAMLEHDLATIAFGKKPAVIANSGW